MGKINEAADQLLAFVERLKPLTDVAEALRGIGSVEQATVDTRKAYEAATRDWEAMKTGVASAESSLQSLRAQMKDEIAAHEENIKRLSENASLAAEAIISEAKLSAEGIVALARSEVKAVVDTHGKKMVSAKQKLEEVTKQVEDAGRLRDEALAHHAEVTTLIEDLREQARKVL